MESGQSINITFYHKGFNFQVTVRDTELPIIPLINKGIEAIEYGIKVGLLPSWNTVTNKEALGSQQAQTPDKTDIPATQAREAGLPIPVSEFEEKCEKCGAKKIRSKKGNMVCSSFCWAK